MTSPHITIVTDENFEKEVLKSDKLVLIDFYSDQCGPCRALAPTLEKFAAENKDTVKVVKVNIEDSPQLTMKFDVKSIPLLVTMKDAQAIFGTLGNKSKSELEELVSLSLQKILDPSFNPPASNKPAPKGPTP